MGEPVTVPLWLFAAIAVFALWSLLDIRVEGAHRLRPREPAIVIANHPCALDGLLLLPLFRRQPIMPG